MVDRGASEACRAEEVKREQREDGRGAVRLAYHSTIVGQKDKMSPTRDGWIFPGCAPGETASRRSTKHGVTAATYPSDYDDSGQKSSKGLRAPPLRSKPSSDLQSAEEFSRSESRPAIGVDVVAEKREFAYSLGRAFHSQRAASVQFLPGIDGQVTRMGSGRGRRLTGMRLVTGEVAGIFCGIWACVGG